MRMQEIAEAIKTLSSTDRHHLRKLLKEQDETDKLEGISSSLAVERLS